jgi:hypothetical protein
LQFHGSIDRLALDVRARDDWEITRDIGKKIAYATGWQVRSLWNRKRFYADCPILKSPSTYSGEPVFGSTIHIEEPTPEEHDALDEAIWSFIGRFVEDYDNF